MPSPPTPSTFDSNADRYDALIDWDRRLKNEGPFYRRLFEDVAAKRVLDTACGTGRHAAMFHSWGLEVEGADNSPAMIALCRTRFGEPPGLRWVQRAFDRPVEAAGSFDAVICVGNSLALAEDFAAVDGAIAAMLEAARPGGTCIIQVLNLWSVAEGPTIWQKCKRVRDPGGDVILLKGLHRTGSTGHIDLVELTLDGGEVHSRFEAATFLGLEPERLTRAAEAAGADDVRLLGSIREEPYDRSTSGDLILVCRRR